MEGENLLKDYKESRLEETKRYNSLEFKFMMPWHKLVLDFFRTHEKGTRDDVSSYIYTNHRDVCVLKAYTRLLMCQKDPYLCNEQLDFNDLVYASAYDDDKLYKVLESLVKRGVLQKNTVHDPYTRNEYVVADLFEQFTE